MSNRVEDLDKDIDDYEEPPTPNWTSSDEKGNGNNNYEDTFFEHNRVGVAEAVISSPSQVGPAVEDPDEYQWHGSDQPSTLTRIDFDTITKIAKIRLPIQIPGPD